MQENKRNIAPIKQRILQYLKSQGITRYQFYQESGMGKGILDKKTGLTEENILKFFDFAPNISAEWLIRGQGMRSLDDIKDHYRKILLREGLVEEPRDKYAVRPKKDTVGRESENITVTLEIDSINTLKQEVYDLKKRVNQLKKQK